MTFSKGTSGYRNRWAGLSLVALAAVLITGAFPAAVRASTPPPPPPYGSLGNPDKIPGPFDAVPTPGTALAGDPYYKNPVQIPDPSTGTASYVWAQSWCRANTPAIYQSGCNYPSGHCVPKAMANGVYVDTSDWSGVPYGGNAYIAIMEPVIFHVSNGSGVGSYNGGEDGDVTVTYPGPYNNANIITDVMSADASPTFGASNVYDDLHWDITSPDNMTPQLFGGWIITKTFRQLDKVTTAGTVIGGLCKNYVITGTTADPDHHWGWWSWNHPIEDRQFWDYPPMPCTNPGLPTWPAPTGASMACTMDNLYGTGDGTYTLRTMLDEAFAPPGQSGLGYMGTLPDPGQQTYVEIPTCAWIATNYPDTGTTTYFDSPQSTIVINNTLQSTGAGSDAWDRTAPGWSQATIDWDVFAEASITADPVQWSWGEAGATTQGGGSQGTAPISYPKYLGDGTWQNSCTVYTNYPTVSGTTVTVTATQTYHASIEAYWVNAAYIGNTACNCDNYSYAPIGNPSTTVGWSQSAGFPRILQIEGVPSK